MKKLILIALLFQVSIGFSQIRMESDSLVYYSSYLAKLRFPCAVLAPAFGQLNAVTLDGFVVVVAVVVVAVATAGQRKSGNELLDVGGVHVLANDHNGPKTNLFPKQNTTLFSWTACGLHP